MRFIHSTATPLLIVCVLAITASAHPGHGESGAAHYLTEPQHVLPLALLAAGVIAIGCVLFRGRIQERA